MTEKELFQKALSRHITSKDRIMHRAKKAAWATMREENSMRKSVTRTGGAFLAAVLIVSLLAGGVFAASRLFTPKEIAVEMQNDAMQKAFSQPEAVLVNESRTKDGVEVTFLGVAPGRDLALAVRDQPLEVDKTYAAIAIARTDGTPMTHDDTFFVTPLIHGCNPVHFHAITLGASLVQTIQDGVLYRILACENVEIFADRQLYLGVTNTPFPDAQAFTFDKATGDIAENAAYSGLNLLFALPLDADKADPQKAQAFVDDFYAPVPEDPQPKPESAPGEYTIPRTPDGLPDTAAILQTARPLEASRTTVKADAQGNYLCEYTAVDEGGFSSTITSNTLAQFKPGEPFVCFITESQSGDMLVIWYTVVTKLDDSSIEFVVYEDTP